MNPMGRASTVRWAARMLYHSRLLWPLSMVAGCARRSIFQILTYHRVNDDQDPFFPSVPTRVFERHMAYVTRVYSVLPVEVLVERMRQGRLPCNGLAITFDDGYRDNLIHAAPILARYRLPATLFLATGFIGAAEVPWFDRIALAIKTTTADSVAAPWGGRVNLGGQMARLDAMDRLLRHLKQVPDDDMRRSVDQLLGALGVTDQQRFKGLMLSWDDVHALVGLGFSIGAHTVNHPILSRVTAQRAWMEILGSRTMIESACGRPPKAFAYPNGRREDYSETVKQLVRQAGFTCAVTTRFGLNNRETCPYELRRGGPWEHDLSTFAMKLAAYRLSAVSNGRR